MGPDPTAPQPPVVRLGTRRLPLAEFLAACADSLRPGAAADAGSDLILARDLFVSAGLPAVRLAAGRPGWIQHGLDVTAGRYARVYDELLRTAEDLLGSGAAGNFFFMHKPPGLRVRFETRPADRARLVGDLTDRYARWAADGLIGSAVPGVYEPEAHLFGGPVSMDSVHALFTADAVAWLRFHTLPDGAGPAWALSLSMVRALFDGLEIVGWEDRDVWDRIRRDTGRRLAPAAVAITGFEEAAAGIRRAWSQGPVADLTPSAVAVVDRFRSAAATTTREWRERYFTAPGAYVGPREAAAYVVVYHWNRGRLPALRQALMAESLARPTVDA